MADTALAIITWLKNFSPTSFAPTDTTKKNNRYQESHQLALYFIQKLQYFTSTTNR